MAPIVVEDVQVEVCPTCSGVWVDWMDGQVQTVSQKLDGLGGGQATKPSDSPGPAQPGSPGTPLGEGACPVCTTPLESVPYGSAAIELLRCGDCAGTFIPRASLELVGATGTEEREPEDPLLTRVIDRLSKWVLD